MRTTSTIAASALLLLLGLPVRTPEAEACAIASPVPVTISGEEALIVWNPESGTEHFIRTAAFSGARRDFGFFVPTPATPTFHEAPSDIFRRLFQVYRQPMPQARNIAMGMGRGAPQSAGVTVVSRQEVAGLDASVLAASDASALRGWLAQHGYPNSDALQAYFEPYVQRRWLMSAFKIEPGQGGGAVGTRAMVMSFRTQTPYFPYAEPPRTDSTESPGRPFRVSVLAPYRVTGSLGQSTRYQGNVGFAAPVSRVQVTDVLRGTGINVGELPQNLWLTVFDEPRSRRGREDLMFRRAANRRVAPRLTRPIALDAVPNPLAGLEL